MGAAVAVIDSGSGNLRSVERALIAAGAKPLVTSDPDLVAQADRIVVPGQGAFGDCVRNLRSRGLDEAIAQAIASGKPYFGICLGLQILFESSEEGSKSEDGEAAGLGLLKGHVKRFDPKVGKVPHMGWNSVVKTHEYHVLNGIDDGTYFYFIHSYYAAPDDDACVVLRCDYGGPFVAAVQQDNIFACQFHPEKSQGAGLRLLANFMAQ